LSALLIDVVHGGASVGFLAPLTVERATAYWQQVLSSLGSRLALLIAEQDGAVVGTVQLALVDKENARHRAEIQKLQVLSSFRGQGLSTKLMAAAEELALANGRTLLVLDTEAGSLAESVYRRLGWQKVGEIPQYAGKPDGQLIATAYYYKLLR
jgi:acetyltransferase